MATELQTFLYINIHLLSVDTKSLLVKIHSCLKSDSKSTTAFYCLVPFVPNKSFSVSSLGQKEII